MVRKIAGWAKSSIMLTDSGRLIRGKMARSKLLARLVPTVAVACLMAILNIGCGSEPATSDHTVVQNKGPDDRTPAASRKTSKPASDSDAILKNLSTPSRDSDAGDAKAPLMQTKQIKMH